MNQKAGLISHGGKCYAENKAGPRDSERRTRIISDYTAWEGFSEKVTFKLIP